VIVAGIDPGVTGALAVIGEESQVYDLGVASIGSTNQLSPQALAHQLIESGADVIVIEDNRANGMNGSKANFSMGLSLGVCYGVIGTLGRRLIRVKPHEWQKSLGLGSVVAAQRKEAHRQRARELFPELDDQLSRKKDHNRADALLIAEYGRKQP